MTPLTRNLRALMAARGIKSMRALSLGAQLSESTVKTIFDGRSRSARHDTLQRLAKYLGTTIEQLVEGRGSDAVPLIGTAGAGEEIIRIPDEAVADLVEAPGPLRHGACVAVRGDSMLPVYRDGDLIFFERPVEEFAGGVAPDALRRDCVVELADGRMFVKAILPGVRKGRFHLVSYNRPDLIADAEVLWAAPVKWVKRG